MNKKVLSLLLVLTLLFVACGQDTPATEAATEAGTEATVTEAADTEATETQTDDTEEAADDGVAKDFTGRTMNVVATSESYVPLFDKFTEETGAKVEFISMSSGEVISRVKAEGGTPMADLWFGGGLDAFMQAKEDGLLEQTDVPEAADVPAEFKDEEGYWYSKGLTIVGLLVNLDVLEDLGLDEPVNWKDLTDPQYKNEIIMSNPAISGTNYAFVKGMLELFGEEEGWAFFEALNENIPYYSKRGGDPKELTNQGEFAIGIIPADKSAHDLTEESNVKVLFGEEGIPWVPEGVAVFKGGEGADIAQEFINFMLRTDNQEMIAEIDGKDGSQMVKPGVDGFALNVPAEKFVEQDLSTFGTQREAILERFTSIMGDKAQE